MTWFLFYRFFFATTIALAILLIYSFFTKNKHKIEINVFNTKGWLLGLFLFGSYLFQTIGLTYTTPSNAAFITSLSVILVPLVLILKGKKLNPLNIASFIIATIGLAFITIEFSTLQFNIGDIIVLGTAVCLAIQIVYTDQFVKIESPIDLTISQLLCTTVLSFLSAVLFEIKDFKMIQTYSEPVYFALILTALFATIYGFFVQTYSQETVNPILIAIIFTFEPVFALLISLWVGEEMLNITKVVGMGLIVLATVLAIIQENRNLKKTTIISTII